MYFYLSKTLSFLLNPLVWIIGLFIWSFFQKKKKPALYFGFSLLVIFTNPLLSDLVMKSLESPSRKKEELPIFDVGIVLTGVTHFYQEPEDQVHLGDGADRVTEAIRLYKNGFIQRILISGGSGSIQHQEIRESDLLVDLFLASGIPKQDILIENQSKNTYENARFSADLLKEKHLDDRRLLLITSAYHIPRAQDCFNKQGLEVTAYPVDYRTSITKWSLLMIIPSVEALINWEIVIREWVGGITYKVLGYS